MKYRIDKYVFIPIKKRTHYRQGNGITSHLLPSSECLAFY